MNLYHNLIDQFIRTDLGRWMVLHVFSPVDKRLIRWTKGAISSSLGTNFRAHAVLLCCTGAKSGELRTIPLLATSLGEQFVLVASAIGQEKNPAWYHNLKAHPNCSLIVPGCGKIPCVSHEAEGEERARAWQAANQLFSGYTLYQAKTARQIPVMVLTPVSPNTPTRHPVTGNQDMPA